MKTKISLLTGLTTGLLFAAALPLAALPGPDDYKKLQDDVNKAYLQDQADKAAAKSKASTSTSELAPGMRGWANGPQNSSAPNASPTRQPLQTPFSNQYAPASPQSPSASDKKGTLFDVNNPNGVDNAGSQQSTNETEDWHKKNKKKHHDGDDRYSVNFGPVNPSEPTESWKKGKKHWNKNSEGATGSSFDNSTYDGAPVHYHKPKPTSDTEGWHKKNKYEHHHHEGDGNATPQGQKWMYMNLPKDGTAKKTHHHHGDD